MIRRSISCALAGLLIVVPVLAFLFMLLGHWQPGSGSIALLIFSFAVGAMWLATEVSEILRGQQQSLSHAAQLLAFFSGKSGLDKINDTTDHPFVIINFDVVEQRPSRSRNYERLRSSFWNHRN